MWQEGTGEKDFPVLRDSRSRYVERNDIIMMIYNIYVASPNFCGLNFRKDSFAKTTQPFLKWAFE